MKFYVPAVVLLSLTACGPQVPESGVGFGDYTTYEQQQAAREAKLQGRPQTSGAAQTSGPAQTATQTSTPTPRKTGISDEQDFGAVSGRESIESDKERLARQRAQYVVIEPTDVPTGRNGKGATVVEFALSTTNSVGQSVYSRSKILAQSRFVRNCLKYPSPDLAQAEFLQNGGPKKDRKGLDPDGDGFACSWDPEPFRNAKRVAPTAPVVIVETQTEG